MNVHHPVYTTACKTASTQEVHTNANVNQALHWALMEAPATVQYGLHYRTKPF